MIDTAGLRYDPQEIEKQGILKVNELLEKADLVLVLLSSEDIKTDFLDILNDSWKHKHVVSVINKADLSSVTEIQGKVSKSNLSSYGLIDLISISVSDETGIQVLFDKMSKVAEEFESYDQPEIINIRQSEAMEAAMDEIKQGLRTLDQSLGDEFVLSHLNRALKELFSITFIDNEEIIRDKIFKDFCLGK